MWVAHFLARNKSNRRVEVVRNTHYFQRTREKKNSNTIFKAYNFTFNKLKKFHKSGAKQ